MFLSVRARRVLTAAGIDYASPREAAIKVAEALRSGVKWPQCGCKTQWELALWGYEVNPDAEEILKERDAVALLESRGYTIIPPNAGVDRPTMAGKEAGR